MTTERFALGTLVFDPSPAAYAPMVVNLKPPPSFALLGFSVVNDQYVAVNFWYMKHAARLSQVSGKMMFVPNVPLTLLVWCAGEQNDYPGVFLQTLVIKGRAYHIFDRTNYVDSGEVL